MSKPPTAQPAAKYPPRQSAWSKGPPQASSSSRSHSPVPSTPTAPTHSRRPSALSGVPIKEGVSVPRNNVGAVKQGSAVTFGSIDDVSAPISSSPATAPSIKSEGVKSFGTIEADTHVNGKSALSSRPSAAAPISAANSTSSTPAVSVATPTPSAKLARPDIAKLFQNPSSAPSSQPSSDTSSPSLRATGLPSSQPSSSQPAQSSTPSQPSQLGPPHPFTPYRHPQPNVGSGAPRSPAYPARQVANGAGPRSQGGPNGAPSQMNAGMSSPRLATLPHNGQPGGMPPPPQMQPPMAQQIPVGWTPYYYPGVPESHYYPPAWYPPPPHHPPPGGPHGPPHTGIPISPRNPPIPLQNSGTPTMSHAAASPVHPPHPPPPITHPSTSISSISSPPPTPSSTSSRLNAGSAPFVPPRTKVTLKTADGTEVNLSNLKPGSSPANNASTNGQVATIRQGSPGTPNRRGVRLETPEQHDKRVAEEERVKAEAKEKARRAKEELERSQREEERKRAEEERKKREAEEEKERERLRQEEEEKKERIRKEEEEKERIRKEEEREKLRKEEEERERIRKEEEEKERVRKEEERKREEERQRIEEEERKRKEEEEQKRKEEEEEKERQRLRREEEERERLRQEEEERERLRQEEEKAAKAKAAEQAKEQGETIASGEGATAREDSKEKKELLRINTSETLKKRPERLDLSSAVSVPAPLPSALATARVIDDLSRVPYPEGISSPKLELNLNAKDGKFRYDREFLLQFMAICKEKPDMLPPLDAIGLEPIDQSSLAMTRGGSGRGHRQASGSSSRSGGIGLGFVPPSGFGKSAPINPFAGGGMGNFSTSGAKLTSEERFQMATNRSASVGGPAGLNYGRPVPMQRTASQGGPGGSLPSHRTRSQRGKQREANKMGGPTQQSMNSHPNMQPPGFEPIVPLKATENRWDRKAIAVDADSPEMVDRRVRGLLNKLTMERFDSISDQIIEWANRSEREKDGRTLIQVIRLVFEKATDEATWSEMYARLCRKMMEQISSKVQDDGIKNTDGKPIAGGQLFRKYLLNRCQEDFERGWFAKEATAAAAATKAMEDQATRAANEKSKEGGDEEIALYSEEYYAAQKAKRQGLGLIKFIGELFKLQMLTERIMHECVKKLLGNVNNPEEEEIESLCKLLTTVGQLLDTPKAHAHMDVYFQRMKELTKSQNVSSRMQFMLQDIIELRERKWVSRNAVAAPATIAQIHEAAAKEKAAQEKEYSQRQISMSRGGSRRGGDRNDHPQVNPEGWAVAGNAARPPPKAGDLSNFGKISNKALPTTFGPSSVFAGKKDKRESLSRTSSSSNMFSMLQNAESGADKAPEAPPQRKKLALLPRSKPREQPEAQQQESSDEEEASEAAATLEMSEETAKKKIDEDSKEFFGVRNLDEAEVYFTALPVQYHHQLVDKLVSTAIESKEADAQLVSDLFARAASKNLCSAAALEEGCNPVAEIIDDIAIDAPKAFSLFAAMVKGAGLDEERRSRLASKSIDSDKLLALLS